MTADRCEVVNGPSERYHPAVTSQRTSGKWMLGNANGRRWIRFQTGETERPEDRELLKNRTGAQICQEYW